MNRNEFQQRTKRFALSVIHLVEGLSPGRTAEVIGRQLLRSGLSIGANYRAACRGRSPADMIAKLKIVEEEADEVLYWLELLEDAGLVRTSVLEPLKREASEIVAMTVASIKTLRLKAGGK